MPPNGVLAPSTGERLRDASRARDRTADFAAPHWLASAPGSFGLDGRVVLVAERRRGVIRRGPRGRLGRLSWLGVTVGAWARGWSSGACVGIGTTTRRTSTAIRVAIAVAVGAAGLRNAGVSGRMRAGRLQS